MLAVEHAVGLLAAIAGDNVIAVKAFFAPALAAHLVDRAVTCHAIQPRPQLVGHFTADERLMCAQQDVLHDVLGVMLTATQQAARVTCQRAAMTLVEDGERGRVPGADAP